MTSGTIKFRTPSRRLFLAGCGGLTGAFLTKGVRAEHKSWDPAYSNRRIHGEAHNQISRDAGNGISAFAFTPSDGWALATLDGRISARNIPDSCFRRLLAAARSGHRINSIAFPPNGNNSWAIATDRNIYTSNIPPECNAHMISLKRRRQEIKHIAFPPSGGNSWVVVTESDFSARNIDDECFQMMRNLAQYGRNVTRVEFAWKDRGFVIVADDGVFARRIDQECYQQIRSFSSANREIHTIAFRRRTNGWSIYSRARNKPRPPSLARKFEGSFKPEAIDIWQRLRDGNVPGCAVAAIENNQIAWMGGYGILEKGRNAAVHPESKFQVASVSKPVSAIGVMHLVERTPGLDLTTYIRPFLNWDLQSQLRPEDRETNRRVIDRRGPTIDQILRHRGAIVPKGFNGYHSATDKVPSLLEILNGEGNSPRTEVGQPNSYSGGGYLLLQRLIEQQSGINFAKYMEDNVLLPLGMRDSRFTVVPPREWITEENIAAGHENGGVISGKRRKYPEFAAAGLYSNVIDLAKMIIWLNKRATGLISSGPISRASAEYLLKGSGFKRCGNTGDYWHEGSNAGFLCSVTGNPVNGTGLVVLTNASGDFSVVTDLEEAIREAHGWPDTRGGCGFA